MCYYIYSTKDPVMEASSSTNVEHSFVSAVRRKYCSTDVNADNSTQLADAFFVIHYRKTPHESSGKPCECCVFGRIIPSRFTLLNGMSVFCHFVHSHHILYSIQTLYAVDI